ncbi:MAG: nuclear transport factor 2 family protein [Gemmatimonadota bacterium]
MRVVGLIIAVAALPAAAFPGAARAQDAPEGACETPAEEAAGVCAALHSYLQGHATGQRRHAEAAFHPDARMIWVSDGELRRRPIDEYLGGFEGEPAEDEAEQERWVETVDVTGDAAIAKIVFLYPGGRTVDYATLLRTGGEWRIIHKSFQVEPASR